MSEQKQIVERDGQCDHLYRMWEGPGVGISNTEFIVAISGGGGRQEWGRGLKGLIKFCYLSWFLGTRNFI